jgi:hypothetical protein
MIRTQNCTCRRPLTRDFLYGKLYFWSISVWAIVFVIKCLSDQMSSGQLSFWANGSLGKRFLGKCLSGQMSFWSIISLGKCPSGQISSGQMSFWANVFLGNCHLGKCYSGQMSLGKCLWANVVWANVMIDRECCSRCITPVLFIGSRRNNIVSLQK